MLELKKLVGEIKKQQKGLTSNVTAAEERISDLKMMKSSKSLGSNIRWKGALKMHE